MVEITVIVVTASIAFDYHVQCCENLGGRCSRDFENFLFFSTRFTTTMEGPSSNPVLEMLVRNRGPSDTCNLQ
jgi:hypothetical protein